MNWIDRELVGLTVEEQRDVLRGVVANLTGDGAAPIWDYMQEWDLTMCEARLLNFLVERGGSICGYDQISLALEDGADHGPDRRTLHVWIHHLRRKVGDICTIVTVNGAGVMISSTDAAAIRLDPPKPTYDDMLAQARRVVPGYRVNKNWNEGEKITARSMISEGHPIEEVAQQMGRTVRGVRGAL